LLGGYFLGQMRQSRCFIPRIEAQLRQRRQHTQRDSVYLLADRGKEKRIKFRTHRRVGRPHYILFGRSPCQQLIDRVASLQSDVKNVQDALNGEIPLLRTQIAQFKVRLRRLERDLARAEAALAQCQAQNP
jgi:hypothetical protein